MEKNFQYWMTLLGFSIISMISMTKHFNDDDLDDKDWTTEQRWAVSVAATSLCISALSCIFHFFSKDIFVGKIIEFGMVLSVLGLWCAGLPTILDDEHFIAVGQSGTILNGNVFFSSWGALIFALLLFSKHVQVLLKLEEMEFFITWVFSGATGLVVMATASIYFKDNDCSDIDDVEECKRSVFGIILGAISHAVAWFALLLKLLKLPELIIHIASILLLVAWAIAAAYITFDDGPATQIGTMYFATWASFLLTIHLGSTGFKFLVKFFEEKATPVAENNDGNNEKAVDAGAKGNIEDAEEEEVGEAPQV